LEGGARMTEAVEAVKEVPVELRRRREQ